MNTTDIEQVQITFTVPKDIADVLTEYVDQCGTHPSQDEIVAGALLRFVHVQRTCVQRQYQKAFSKRVKELAERWQEGEFDQE